VLGQAAHDVQIGVVILQVDIGDVELLGQCFRDLILGNEAVVHQHATQLASAALLLLQRELQLIERNEFLLYQQVAEANFFRTRHNSP